MRHLGAILGACQVVLELEMPEKARTLNSLQNFLVTSTNFAQWCLLGDSLGSLMRRLGGLFCGR
eukprot:8074295-Pyramimonas_sp.AAC.1